MPQTLLITGGCGFIGSHFVRLILNETDYKVVNLDALTYAGHLANTADCATNQRYRFVHGSITDRALVAEAMLNIDAVCHFAAESHVDNSIANPAIFVETNVLGTQVLLDAARAAGVRKFVHVSTDEVYGSLALDEKRRFVETDRLAPSSPYSASKAGSDLLALAAHHTHGLPVCVSRCSNNYGTHQLPEKLIPLAIHRALRNEPIPVYGDGQNVRDWIHVTDHCRAVLAILEHGQPGEIYNAGADNEWTNLDLLRLLLKILGKPESLLTFVPDRLGHDRRYAIESGKLRAALGWAPQRTDFSKELAQVVEWYVAQNG